MADLVNRFYKGGTWWIPAQNTDSNTKGATEVAPMNGTDFTLEELQGFVGGYIEIVTARDGRLIVLNEEGKLNGLPVNVAATILYANPNDAIVGDVLICDPSQIR